MASIHTRSLWVIFVAAAAGSASAAGPEFQVELRSGATETIRPYEIADGMISSRDLNSGAAALDEIISIRRIAYQDDWTERTGFIWLSNGDRMAGEPVEITDDLLKMRWRQFPASEALTIPLEYVAAISWNTPASLMDRQKLFRQLATEPQRGDVAWLVSGDRISGEFTGFSRGEFHFTTEAGKLPIVAGKLAALRFDPELLSAIKPLKTRYIVSFTDGSRLTASRLRKDDQQVSFTLAMGIQGALPADELVGIQVFTPRVEALSQRKPEAVQFTPYLAGNRTWRKDRNVLQGPLQLRGQEFGQGLGVHSRTTLTYAVEPQDRELRAVVGIDDAAEGKGHVRFLVAVDGKAAWESPPLTGTSKPAVIPPIKLSGAKRLELTVDFGEFGDVRDYADWCEPIILRDE